MERQEQQTLVMAAAVHNIHLKVVEQVDQELSL
jgi:hypothetical protein